MRICDGCLFIQTLQELLFGLLKDISARREEGWRRGTGRD
jgi:hypothetical protein